MDAELGGQVIDRLTLAVAGKKLMPAHRVQVGLWLAFELGLSLPARLRRLESQTPKPQGWVRKRK